MLSTGQGKYDEAIQACDKQSRLILNMRMPGATKVMLLTGQGKYDEAIQACDKAIEIDPHDAWAWENKGNALNHLGSHCRSQQGF